MFKAKIESLSQTKGSDQTEGLTSGRQLILSQIASTDG